MSEFERAAPALAAALNARGYETMTPVQKAVLDPELDGADLLVSAQTGSGKTVAFGLAVAPTLLDGAERLGPAGRPLALAIAPTRELALQVKRELAWLYAETGAVIASCVGGMDGRAERRALQRGAHIVVGTPGRLRDHLARGALETQELRAVILDEADEMLDLGFREDLEFILEATPETRRTLLFSATVPPGIAKLAQRYQRNAARVATVEERAPHADIEYQALVVAPREGENAVINVLRYHEAGNALVFCNTRAAVNRITSRFNNRGFQVVALSGELSQNERNHALQALRSGRARVCIATDVAARGIDLPRLDLVIHAELPTNPETLLHRSGRTGRAGRKGVSALIVEPRSRAKAERMLRLAGVEANWMNPPSADAVIARDQERMLTDPILTDPIGEDEAAFAKDILEKFPAEQIAAAYLRMTRERQSAPEDIEAVPVTQPRQRLEKGQSKGKRNERFDPMDQGGGFGEGPKGKRGFEDSVWVTLSVGRRQNADPKWLIPMLCNEGRITKRDIGAIKIQQGETHVELNAAQIDRFLHGVGRDMTIDKNIRIRMQDGPPPRDLDQGPPPGRPRGPKGPGPKRGSGPKRTKDRGGSEGLRRKPG